MKLSACNCGGTPVLRTEGGFGRFWFQCDKCEIQAIADVIPDEAGDCWEVLIKSQKEQGKRINKGL